MTETASRLKELALRGTHVQVRTLSDEQQFDQHTNQAPCVGITTPIELITNLMAVPEFLDRLELVVLDDLQMLDEAYEMAVMQIMLATQYATTRVVALSTSLHDAYSLADWLRIPDEGIYTFRATDRAIPLTTTIQPYSIANSGIMLRSMVKPVYASIKASLPGSTIIFVPSAKACKTVAADLITQSGMEIDLNGFLGTPRQDLEANLRRMKNPSLMEPMLHGIGIYHDEVHSRDLSTTLQLFAGEIIKVLIVPRESCWTLPTSLSVSNVIVMGAQYLELETTKAGIVPERRTKNYTVLELTRMQGFATRPVNRDAMRSSSEARKFTIMCQPEQKNTYNRFLSEGLPLESSLRKVIAMEADLVCQIALQDLLGEEPKRQDLVDLLGWSFLWVRLRSNPNYYDVAMSSQDEEGAARGLSRIVDQYFNEFHSRRRMAGQSEVSGSNRQAVLDRLEIEGGQVPVEAAVNGGASVTYNEVEEDYPGENQYIREEEDGSSEELEEPSGYDDDVDRDSDDAIEADDEDA